MDVELTNEQEDAVQNALYIGMTLERALLYAGLTGREIKNVLEDGSEDGVDRLYRWRSINSSLELTLLERMNRVSSKQAAQGKENATAWMLERLYPERYGPRPVTSDKMDIHIDIPNVPLEGAKNVDIVK